MTTGDFDFPFTESSVETKGPGGKLELRAEAGSNLVDHVAVRSAAGVATEAEAIEMDEEGVTNRPASVTMPAHVILELRIDQATGLGWYEPDAHDGEAIEDGQSIEVAADDRWEGQAGLWLTPAQARMVGHWLLNCADALDPEG